ncbi:MAG: hypothetical protein Q8940_19255 [Bacteroidota bacterium]|nr:hypothetical protein [Bacteroidota bacterium]
MEHNKNILNVKYPIFRRVSNFIMAVIAVVSAIEWNRITDSYWGFLFLVVALPGLFYTFMQAFKKLFKNNPRRGF